MKRVIPRRLAMSANCMVASALTFALLTSFSPMLRIETRVEATGTQNGTVLHGNLVLVGQPRIEHPAVRHVARKAAGGDDDALPRLDVHRFVLERRRHPLDSWRRIRSNDARETVTEQDLDALRPRALFKSAHEPRSGTAIDRDVQVVRVHLRAKQPRHGSAVDERRHHLFELDAVVQQKVERRGVFVGPDADEIAIAQLWGDEEVAIAGVVETVKLRRTSRRLALYGGGFGGRHQRHRRRFGGEHECGDDNCAQR